MAYAAVPVSFYVFYDIIDETSDLEGRPDEELYTMLRPNCKENCAGKAKAHFRI